MDHPPYSPNLAPSHFWLFPKLKNALEGQRFADIPDIQCNMILLRGILVNDFQDCFRQWHHRLMKCIASQGEYFEGDNSC
jgi:histone-lysine N-methyltransferase SETMAR